MKLEEELRAAMHARLDAARVRALDARALDARVDHRRRRRTRARTIALVAATGSLALGIGFVANEFADAPAGPVAPAPSSPVDGTPIHEPGQPIPLDAIPEGVSAHRLGDLRVFIVRDGNDVTVFDTDIQHQPGEGHLWWCPNERVFAAPAHGELFDARGRYLAGPAARGLTTLPATVRDNVVRIDLEGTPGASRGPESAELPAGYADGDRAWNTGPGSFCDAPLTSRPMTFAIPGPDDFTIPFDAIPEGTSLHHVPALVEGADARAERTPGEPIFIVRDGRHITVFAAVVPDHPNRGSLFWCPAEGVFGSPPDGELYDTTGRVIGDTANRGLLRINSYLGDEQLIIDPLTRQPGLAVRRHPSAEPMPVGYTGAWNPAQETTFCLSPLIGGYLGASPEPLHAPLWPAALAIGVGIAAFAIGMIWLRRRRLMVR